MFPPRSIINLQTAIQAMVSSLQTVLAQTQDKALDRIEKLKKEKKMLGERLREIEESRGASSPVSGATKNGFYFDLAASPI